MYKDFEQRVSKINSTRPVEGPSQIVHGEGTQVCRVEAEENRHF